MADQEVLPPPDHIEPNPSGRKKIIIIVVVLLLVCCLVCAIVTLVLGGGLNQGFGDFSKQFEDQFGDKVKQYENQLRDLNKDDSGFSLFKGEDWPEDLPASVPAYSYADITDSQKLGSGGVQGNIWIITAAKSTAANLVSYKNDLTLKNWLIKSQTDPNVLEATLESESLTIQVVVQGDKTAITVS